MMGEQGVCVEGWGFASSLKFVDDFIAMRQETIAQQPDCDF